MRSPDIARLDSRGQLQKQIVFLSLLLLLCLLGFPGNAEEQSVRPGVNKQYQDPEFAVWLNRFEQPGREVFDQRHEIVDSLGIKPGMQVADVGAGTGLFTLLFADKVGSSGKVFAVDISDTFIENILRRSKERGFDQVVGVLGKDRDAGLPAGKLDLIFVCDTYHHFEYPQSMLASFRRSLRPDGKLVIIDFRKIQGVSREWILSHVRTGRKTVINEVQRAGFTLKSDSDLLLENYYLTFELAESAQE